MFTENITYGYVQSCEPKLEERIEQTRKEIKSLNDVLDAIFTCCPVDMRYETKNEFIGALFVTLKIKQMRFDNLLKQIDKEDGNV